jgi:SNF2 family DNA or RNA helicase
MKVSIENQEVTIVSSGMEFLKLKTEINRRLGDVGYSTRDRIKIPLSTLPMIKDLLTLDPSSSEEARKYLESFAAHSIARSKALEILAEDIGIGLPERWSNVLDPAQATAVSAMTQPNLLGLCLFDEQGSGKTVMALAAFDILWELGAVQALIVVCPKSMISEWPKDIGRFLPDKYKVVQGEGDKERKYEAALKDFDVLVTNYESINVMLTMLIAASVHRRYLLVVDESYYLKNGDSVRSTNVWKLRSHCERCFVLCGTPAPNSAHDLLHQFDLADLGYTFGGFLKSNDPVADWSAISDLVENKGLFIRRLKTEILSHVPDKDFHVIRVPLQGRQALMYEKAKTQLVLELKSLDNATFKKSLLTYFQRRSVLLQICSCPSAIDPMLTEMPVKYGILDELVDRLSSSGRKVIIWSYYKKSLDDLMARYARYNPVRVDGSVPSDKRKAAVRSFQEDPTTLLFIGNPAAAGAGITLHASYDAAYISYSNQAAHYLQSLDRIHRRGQTSDRVNYYLIACEGTIEETEIIRLRGKELTQHRLLQDDFSWPSSLDEALKELGPNE